MSRLRSANSQAEIVEAVQSRGFVFYSFEESNALAFDSLDIGWPYLARDSSPSIPTMSNVPGILVKLLGVDFFHSVRVVELHEPAYLSPELADARYDSDRREFDRLISLVSKLDGLHTIHLRCSWKCNLEPLSRLRGLKRVRLIMDVEKNDLAFLKGSGVTTLALGGALDDESLKIISELRGLERLQMDLAWDDIGSTFTNNGVAELVKLEGLKELRLNSDLVDDDVAEPLSKLHNLERLGLRLPATKSPVVHHIALKSLRDIRLLSMVIDSDFFRLIGEMERIEILCLGDSRGYQELSEVDFEILMNSRSLQEVHLGDIVCNEEQYRSLVKKFGEDSFSATKGRQ